MNLIRDCPVTSKDVQLATKIFGPDIATLKGKTIRHKPLPDIDNSIEIPHQLISMNEEVTMFMDGITVNSLRFLSTILKDLYFRTAHYMPRTTMQFYRTAVQDVLSTYRQGGLKVTEIRCDNEFHQAMDPIVATEQPPIKMNYANPQEHVPQAERNNRTIKERVRCVYHRLPFVHLLRILVKYLVIDATQKLNYFPARHGISKYYSPRMILMQENLDYEKHCKYAFGTYGTSTQQTRPYEH